MNRGYIRLYRKSLDSSIFAHEGMWKLFCLCLLKANHKEAEVMLPGILKPIKVKRGEFITGRYELHYEYHQGHIRKKTYSRKSRPTPYTLIRWLQTLQYMQILIIKTYNKYSIISIINWPLYQVNEHQVSIRRASGEHKQELNKNKEGLQTSAKEVLEYLNSKVGRNYQRLEEIEARLNDGATIEQCKTVIDNKLKDPYFQENSKYYHPTTLFRKSHWDKYLNEKPDEDQDPWRHIPK